jgi:predicted RNA-binding Zn-ribbon protein involved in translation (DUF1610 family)
MCTGCHEVVGVNLKDVPTACPKCGAPDPVPYDDPAMQETPHEFVHISWWEPAPPVGRILELNKGDYKCPKCGEFALKFRSMMCFD